MIRISAVTGRMIVAGMALGFLASPRLSAQDAGAASEAIDTKTVTRVTLGSGQGTPGMSVVVPIYFAAASGTEVGSVKMDISFVSENLKFGALERGIAAEMGAVDLKTSIKSAKNDKNIEVSTLTVAAATPGPGKTGIPSGLLGYLSMKIAETGRAAKISLRPTAEATLAGSGSPAANVRGFDGFVEVFAPGELPNVNCFFFTH